MGLKPTTVYTLTLIFCYRCGILGHQDHEYKKITKGCLSPDDDGFQFGPWLRALAPNINQKKNGFQQSRLRDDDVDDFITTREDKFEPIFPPLCCQLTNTLMAGKN